MLERTADREALDRNLALIPIHRALTSAFVWIPIFTLFTQARFGLDRTVLLASAYYLFVVVLEVPSGWASDRLGRVAVLRIAALGFVAAHALFLVGDERFALVLAGQFCLAIGFASLSGSDVSFLYDTMEALGTADGYRSTQARVTSIGFVATTASALVGGALGLVDLRLAFVASLVLALGQLAITMRLSEPPALGRPEPIVGSVVRCLRYLGDRYLGWIFLYGVLLVVLEHVAFTILAPWLAEVLGRSPTDLGAAPLVAGVMFAVVAIGGGGAARLSAPLAEAVGTVAALIAFGVLSAVIVTAMALSTHWAVVVLVALRSAQGAAASVLIPAAVAPRTEQRHRATLLSLNSLGGRLAYGLVLLVVARSATAEVGPILTWLSVIAWAAVAVIAVSAAVLVRPTPIVNNPAR